MTPVHAAGYGKVEKRVRTTGGGATGSVRNLRIREDTAKYLLNLDPNSAHYDPKSRSMREDPQPHKAKKAFAGDNFVRKSGDYHAWEAERMHQLAAYDHGASLHMQAAPSQAEILHQHFKNKKGKLEVSDISRAVSTMPVVCLCTPFDCLPFCSFVCVVLLLPVTFSLLLLSSPDCYMLSVKSCRHPLDRGSCIGN